MRIGFVPSSLFFLINHYKKEILYFDQLAVTSSDIESSFNILQQYCDSEANELYKSIYEQLINSNLLKIVSHQQLLSDFMDDVYKTEPDEIEAINKAGKIYASLTNLDEKEQIDHATQLLTLWLASYVLGIAESENEVIPVYPGVEYLTYKLSQSEKDNIGLKKGKIVEAVLRSVPIIDSNVSWEALADFKQDPDSRNKFLALRNWITQKAHSNLSINEIDEELEYLLSEYERHLSFHKMKHHKSNLELIIVSSAEIIENFARLKFSSVAKKIFSFAETEMDLIEAEMKSPGKEVAYISKIKEDLLKEKLKIESI